MPLITFKAKAKNENSTKTIVKARNFTMTIDEPKNLGGTDDGANPVEYLLAALAGCLNVVGHVVAKEMGLELGNISISLEGDLDPSKFMGKKTDKRAGYEEIRVKIEPEMEATDEQKEEWLKAVESRCPVSDNLANGTIVKIGL